MGCKLNQAETDSLQREFVRRGFTVVPFRDAADLTIINTCTVTNQADAKDRNIIRQAAKASPDGKLAVIGCYAQVSPDEAAALPGVQYVIGSKEKFRIFDYIDNSSAEPATPLIAIDDKASRNAYPENPFETSTTRTRAFLKIQDGCSYFCSYCIIPFARGNTSSRNFQDTVDEIHQLREKGFREIVFTGINIGTYRRDDKTLFDLLRAADEAASGMRLRISSIEVNTLSDAMIDFIAGSNSILPHFHLPLQSGSATILNAMNRKYSPEDFLRKVAHIRSVLPDASIGSDVITGFPGESDVLFRETLDFIKEIRFSYLHLFRYSRRNGSRAATMPDQVSEVIKKERSAQLKKVSQPLKQTYIRSFVGRTDRVLWETEDKTGISGLSDHYIKVRIPRRPGLQPNSFSMLRFNSVTSDALSGEIL